MKWFIENNIDILILLVRNVKSDQPTQNYTTPHQQKEERREKF